MQYTTFKYIYPPRPAVKTSYKNIQFLENSGYAAQPKYNGSCCIVFTNGSELYVYNRHKQPLKYSADVNFRGLSENGKWFAFTGEYLNKSKANEHGKKVNDIFIIWDILVYNDVYIIGQTFEGRLMILEHILPSLRGQISSNDLEIYNHLCCTKLNGIYKAPTYLSNFENLYKNVIETDVYEGLVFKKLSAPLEFGFNQNNNSGWQIKVRKETKIYNF